VRRRRKWIILGSVVAAAVAAITLLLYLRSGGAPQAARLLPESDAVIYVDLSLVRFAQRFGSEQFVLSNEPEYQEFVRETGFRPERDLESAALAVHNVIAPSAPPGRGQPQSPPQRVLRFSEIFIGNFDSSKLTTYLRKLATTTENHRDADIFVIPHEGRTVRVAILSFDTVAASNHDNPQVLRGMIERFRAAAAPHHGPPLVSEYYRHVPFGSMAWGVASLGGGANPGLAVPPAMAPLLHDVTVVASARFTGSLHLRAEALATSAQQAQQIADTANTFVAIFKGGQGATTPTGMDEDVKAFFDSFEVKQEGERAVLTARAGIGFLQKLFQTPPAQPQENAPPKP
jgi:hypothetical protein